MLRAIPRRQRLMIAFLGATAIAATIMNCTSEPAPTGPVTEITVTAAAASLDAPLDATPDPLGKDIYFIANSAKGKGIFKVSAAGGAVADIYVGAPLVDPRGIVMSPDGTTLYVADTQAGMNSGGAIFQLPK